MIIFYISNVARKFFIHYIKIERFLLGLFINTNNLPQILQCNFSHPMYFPKITAF
jgi:hypothetical protein